MNFTEEEIKQIILDESKKYLEEIELAKRMKNAGSLSLEAFINVINILGQDLTELVSGPTVLDMYLEIALDLKRSRWDPKYWFNMPNDEKKIFLKTTYPLTPRDESEDIMISSFINPTMAKVIYSDIELTIEKANDAKKEIKAGEYLGPEELGGEPKSPHWKEYLEEIVKEEIINHLK